MNEYSKKSTIDGRLAEVYKKSLWQAISNEFGVVIYICTEHDSLIPGLQKACCTHAGTGNSQQDIYQMK